MKNGKKKIRQTKALERWEKELAKVHPEHSRAFYIRGQIKTLKEKLKV